MESFFSTSQDIIHTREAHVPRRARARLFNPMLPEFRADPYPFYHRLRAADPVHWSFLNVWFLTRYADVMIALRDPRLSSDTRHWDRYEHRFCRQRWRENQPLAQLQNNWFLSIDPPNHNLLRRLMSKVLTPEVFASMRPRIEQVVNSLLDAVQGAGRMDIMRDLAYPLALTIIAECLGVPAEDYDKLKQWSHDVLLAFDPLMSLEVFEHIERSVLEFMEYFQHLATQRRQHPQGDLISALITAKDQGQTLSEAELCACCVLLCFAGHVTTVNLIGNGMLALFRHPNQLAQLLAEPTLIHRAVEEVARYESPVQFIYRTTIADVEIDGKTIRQGQLIVLCLGAANRDPEQFPEPDRLDITRRDNHHLAFGYGMHYCLGALLGRLEGQITINMLLQRLPHMQLQTEMVEWQPYMVTRGPQTLPVSFRP